MAVAPVLKNGFKEQRSNNKGCSTLDTRAFQRLWGPTAYQIAKRFLLELARPYLSTQHDAAEGALCFGLTSRFEFSCYWQAMCCQEMCLSPPLIRRSRVQWLSADNRPRMNDISTLPPPCFKEGKITMMFSLKSDTNHFSFFLFVFNMSGT